jgi:apolipoprotein N-acyltransferase
MAYRPASGRGKSLQKACLLEKLAVMTRARAVLVKNIRSAVEKNNLKNLNIIRIKKIFLSLVSGILIVLCFPDFNLSFITWVCFIPLLFSINKERPSVSFLYGLLTGISAYCGLMYWIIPTITTGGESFILGLICLLLLSTVCAVFIGIFCLAASYLKSSILSPVVLSSVWVVLEYIRSHFLSGFPWAIIGYSQWNFLPVIQVANFTGVYGVSFIIILVNLTIFQLMTISASVESEKTWTKLKIALPALLIFVIYLFYGFISLGSPHHSPPMDIGESDAGSASSKVKVTILQGNIEQHKKWNKTYRDEIMNVYTSLVRQAKEEFEPDLIVWPESAIPGYLLNNRMLYKRVRELIVESKCYHLIGAVEYGRKEFRNSILFFSPGGKLVDKYSKIHLVPFGETIPFKTVFQRYIKTLNELGHFSPGSRYTVFQMPSFCPVGAHVCFESIFPYISRRLTKNGAQILVNLTNDGWYLKTSAPYQHFVFNIYRAVENHRMVIRSANTGISGLIDEHGRIIVKSGIFKELYKNVSVKPIEKVTFYTRYGDIFVLVCFIIAAVRFILVLGVPRRYA